MEAATSSPETLSWLDKNWPWLAVTLVVVGGVGLLMTSKSGEVDRSVSVGRMTARGPNTKLRATESVWRDSTSGGYVAEIRGLRDEQTGIHEWVRLGVYGSRAAAVGAVVKARG
jgi:hypothetical protein